MIERILVSVLFDLTRATLLSLRNPINITIIPQSIHTEDYLKRKPI